MAVTAGPAATAAGPATREAPARATEARAREAPAPAWDVIVHNDPVNLMTYVTLAFQRVFGYAREKAVRLMLEVHTQGRSIVWTGDLERAEGYLRELHGCQLLATMERVE